MSIFDIFKRGAENTSNLLEDYYDKALKPAIKTVGNIAEDYVDEAVVPAVKLIKEKTYDKALENPTIQKGLESTVGYLNAVDESSQGLLKRDDGKTVLTEDLPKAQQFAGQMFKFGKDIGAGQLGTVSSALDYLGYKGIDSAKPLADKMNDWRSIVEPKDQGYIDSLFSGLGSVSAFLPVALGGEALIGAAIPELAGTSVASKIPGLVGKTKGIAGFINKFSPTFAELFGGSAMATFEAMTEAGDAYKTAKSSGRSEQDAQNAGDGVFWKNMMLIPLTNQLTYYSKAPGLKRYLLSTATEGAQEFGQQVIQNLAAGKTGNAIYEGALEAASIGAIMGGIFGGGDIMGGVEKVETNGDKEPKLSQVAVPEASYRVETENGNKYFETEEEANDYASSNLDNGSYVVSKLNAEENSKIIQDNKLPYFPFENGISQEQIKIDNAINEIKLKTGASDSEAADIFGLVRNLMESEKYFNKSADSIFNEAIEQAKLNIGQEPDIIKEAINIAKKDNLFVKEEDDLSKDIYHQTNADVENIKNTEFKMGKNSIFGEAAFFGENPDKRYGENQIKENTKNYKLKRVSTVKEQQEYIEKYSAENLADAIRKEGKYDGFIIPNKELGNVYGITNKEKLNANLNKQQIISTEEARKQSESFPFIEKMNIPVVAKEKILTRSGQLAYGKYSKAMIEFIENPHKTTIPHEAVHAYMDIMMTDKQKKSVIEEAKRRFAGKIVTAKKNGFYKNTKIEGLSDDAIAEEILAEDMINYIKTGEAASSKLKRFYDWFANAVRNLLGNKNIDIIGKFYEDIQSTPGFAQRYRAEKNIARMGYDVKSLQDEYLQNPDGLTIKFLQNVDVKHREVSSYQFLKDLAKSKSLALKENERNLINDILDTQFNGEKKINMDDFRAAVKSELMPLDVIVSGTYDDYGSENVNKGYDYTYETHIYNSPFMHGYAGHFNRDFYSGFPSREEAEKKIGLFGHVRVWDAKAESGENDTRYVSEIQSDIFQNERLLRNVDPEFNQLYNEIEFMAKNGKSREEIEEVKKANDYYVLKKQAETKAREKFPKLFQFMDNWYERMIREEIRRAAMESKTRLRFPTPYTIAKIEGYLSEDGQIPESTNIGDYFEYAGDSYILLTKYIDGTGKAAPENDVRGVWDFSTVRDEEVNHIIDEINDDPEIYEYEIKENSEYTADKLKDLKNSNRDKFDSVVDEIANKIADSRFTDAESYAEYYSENIEEGFVFSKDNDELIILNDNRNVESFGFGQTELDKENFNYEDLPKEQATVARFYDKQVGKYLAKLRKQNFSIVTDDDGFDWYETNILPDDREAVEAFQTKRNEQKPLVRSSKEVAEYIKAIDEDNGDDTDDYLLRTIEENNTKFILKQMKIDDILKSDRDARDYVEAGENRYSDDEQPSDPNIDLPIVIGNWSETNFGVMDGFNRLLSKKQIGDEYIEAWASEPITPVVRPSAIEPSIAADLEYRRSESIKARIEAEKAIESEIMAYREADLTYPDSEKEAGYQNFKKLASRRPWVLDYMTDDATLKTKLPAINIDNLLFNGDVGVDNNTQLEQFKDRYYQEKEVIEYAKTKTPSELLAEDKSIVEKIVKAEKIGKKPSLSSALNVSMGKQAPIIISEKETTLLKRKLRDMARASKYGAKFGRMEMRDTLNQAFSAKLDDLKYIRKAIVEFAQQLPPSLRGNLLNTVATAKTPLDTVKAYARIDAALRANDNKIELEKIKKMAKKLAKSMKNGKGIAVDYQKKIADILADYNFVNPTKSTIEKLNKLSDYISANPDVNIPDHLIKRLDILKKKSPREMTTENLKDLNELLERLWSLGSLKMAMKGKYDKRFVEESVGKLLITTKNIGDNDLDFARLAAYGSQRFADVLDGSRKYRGYNALMQRKVSLETQKSIQRAEQIIEDLFETISAIKKDFSEEEISRMVVASAMQQGHYSRAEAFVSYHAEEYGWKTKEDLKLSPEMQAALDEMVAVFAKNVNYTAAVYEETENKPFVKVDKYLPFKDDNTIDKSIDINAPTINQMAQYESKQVAKGFTYKRKKGVKNILRKDLFNVVSEVIMEQEYYNGVQPVLNEVANIVNDKRYQKAVGKNGVMFWDRYLKGIANRGRSIHRGVLDNRLAKARLNISKAVLGYKVTSALLQPTAIIDAYAYIYLNYGAIPANAALIRLAGTIAVPGYSKGIVNKSLALKIRKGGETALEELSSDNTGNKLSRAFVRGGMAAIKGLDIRTAAAVQQTMFKHFIGMGMSVEEAQKEADFVMNLTQGSASIGDLPIILTDGELMKTLLTFQTFALNRWGIIAHDVINTSIVRGMDAKYNKKTDTWEVKRTLISKRLKGVISLFIMMIAGGVENELRKFVNETVTGKNYKDDFNFMAQSLLTIPESLPLIGSWITSAIEYAQPGTFPLQRVLSDSFIAMKNFVSPPGETNKTRDKNRKKAAFKIAETIATLYGVTGTAQASDIIESIIFDSGNDSSSKKSNIPERPQRDSRPSRPERMNR